MKKMHPILFLFLNFSYLFGQENKCKCFDELKEISEEIINSKSYKIEIKRKNRKEEFSKWREKIHSEIAKDSLSNFFCVGYLQKYISFINDKHNQVYFIPNDIPSDFPIYYDELNSPKEFSDSISGIYFAGTEKIRVKKINDQEWAAILLESDYDIWKKGHLRMRIRKQQNDLYELFEFHPNGMLYYQYDIKISDGRIHSTFWNKDNKYFFNKHHKEAFNYESLNPSFDYIGIKTLARTKALIKEADSFYDTIFSKFHKKNLIIDLRNNGGGSILQAKPLLKHLKKNKAIQKIYVLINFKTGSAAEMTALQLAQDKRTILVGENSSGILTYGYGNKSYFGTTDCSDYKFSFTTERTNQKFQQYEYVGITPDLYLNNNSEWIEQIIELKTNSDSPNYGIFKKKDDLKR